MGEEWKWKLRCECIKGYHKTIENNMKLLDYLIRDIKEKEFISGKAAAEELMRASLELGTHVKDIDATEWQCHVKFGDAKEKIKKAKELTYKAAEKAVKIGELPKEDVQEIIELVKDAQYELKKECKVLT
jgi:hypothetical protein